MTVRLGTEDSFDRLAQHMGEMVDCLFQKSYVGFRPSKGWEPAINIYEDADHLIVCVELSGMCRNDIDVKVEPGRLIVKGMRPDPEAPDQERPLRVHHLEIRHGPFERTLNLPLSLDIDATRAQYRNGYLWVFLPKLQP